MDYILFGTGACIGGVVSGMLLQVSMQNGEYSRASWVPITFFLLMAVLLGICIWALVSVGVLAAIVVAVVAFIAQRFGMRLIARL